MSRISYPEYLLDLVRVDPAVIPLYQSRTHGEWGVGIDAVSALDVWPFGFPRFQGLDLEPGSAPHMGYTPASYADGGFYRFHFPDGNASIARLLLRSLVPQAVPARRPIRQHGGQPAHRGPAFFAYSANYRVDADHAIIVDVAAIRQAEILAAKRMIERSLEHFDLYPERLIGDSAYGSTEMLNWLVHDRGIEPHIPVFDKSQRTDGTFSRDDFAYDHATDAYRCPAGKTLQHYRRRFAGRAAA